MLFLHNQQQQILQPKAIAATISNDLITRENSFQKLLNDTLQLTKIFQSQLSLKEIQELEQQPFLLYAFRNNELIFWNNNYVIGSCNDSELLTQSNLLFNNGVYLKKCLPFNKANQKLIALFPIAYKYPFENKYLVSHLAANENISTEIVVKNQGVNSIQDIEGKTVFYVDNVNNKPLVPDSTTCALMLISIILTIIWITLIAVDLSKRKSNYLGFGVIAATIGVICMGVSFFGLPFQLENTLFFSPRLYASSKILSSLGYLIFYLSSSLWLLLFLLLHKRGKIESKFKKGIVISLVSVALGIVSFLSLELIRSLVLDSNISFDVAHFYSIGIYTVVGLVCVLLITTQTVLGLYYINELLTKNIPGYYARIIHFIGSIFFVFLFVDQNNRIQFGYGVAWVAVFLVLLNFVLRKNSTKFFSSRLVLLATFVVLSNTVALLIFSHQKQETELKSYAERIVNQRDNMMEFLFENIANNILKDNWLQTYLDSPQADTRILIDEHLTTSYFSGTLNRFDSKFLLFDNNYKPIYNSDTVSFSSIESKLDNADSVAAFLFHSESKKAGETYASLIPIFNEKEVLVGYVFIDLKLKSGKQETIYPELLLPENLNENLSNENAACAIYVNQELKSQIGNYSFPVFLNEKAFKGNVYQVDAEKSVVIVDSHNEMIEAATLFSYLLGIVVFISAFIAVSYYSLVFFFKKEKQKIYQLTLQKRIQFSMLSLVIVALLIIGIVTISFFIQQSKQTNKEKLQQSMQVAERSIKQYFIDSKITPDAYSFDKVTESASFKNFINRLVEEHGIDINIYNKFGSLNATSQEGIYNKSILARIIMPDAYFKLLQDGGNSIVQEEKIGKLNYLSSYLAFETEHGETIGYINIPFFSSQKELSYQISNLVVALIDLFAIIFLISGLFTVIITRWLTSKLQMIIDKFKGFNLQANETLEWPYEDEIGLLVNEYNKMVKKVEAQAQQLSKTERESAWREMAKQVAHEIKNPLTPMKLNVQYLQQALSNNHPNAKQMTELVAQSMIEQIDNLTHIASAFSDFAKMPEAAPENIELNNFIKKATEIYKSNIDLHLTLTTTQLIVFIDKSQLLRVITNIVQNAIEAIPEGKKGVIDIVLIEKEGVGLLEIKDNGNGIPADVVEHIFDPYFTTKGSGTGLGLAMTKRIVEFWNGRIWFETSVQGTSFFIELPMV